MPRIPGITKFAIVLSFLAIGGWLISPNIDRREPPPVEITVDAPPRAILRNTAFMEVRVTNRSNVAIEDLGVKINRAYANALTVIQTIPASTIDDASNEKRIYFGILKPDETKTYRINMSPQRAGNFALTVKVVSAQRGFGPIQLTDRMTGKSEFLFQTLVVDPRVSPSDSPPVTAKP